MVSFGGSATLPSPADAAAVALYVAGLLGNLIASVLNLAAACAIIRMCRHQDVGGTWVVPYMAALLNAVIWGLGGLPSVQPGGQVMLAVNGISFLFMFVCTITYLCFAGDDCFGYFIALAFEVMFGAMVWALVLTLPHTPESRARSVGFCGCFTATVMNALPLWLVKRAKDNGNAHHISVLTAAVALLNAVVWVIYSSVDGFKKFVFIPNITGVVVWSLLLFVCFHYRNAPAA